MCPERMCCLKNQNGNALTVRLRRYRSGDEEGMISCIRDEYGGSYFKRDFYRPEFFRREAHKGHLTLLVAETRYGEIAGMMMLKKYGGEENGCEIASQIFKKKYRGYGLATPFFEYGLDILRAGSCYAVCCLPVLFHDITQTLLYRQGLRAAGMVLNVFDLEMISHSYINGRNQKHSQGIQIMAHTKRDAGTLYIPPEHREFCRGIYESLGVRYRLAESGDDPADRRNEMPAKASITCTNDAVQSSLEIGIHIAGKDLVAQLHRIHDTFPLKGKQTANVFLNANDRFAPEIYAYLKEQGYFFTGLKPLCKEREYMVLHHPGQIGIWFEDYALSPEFRVLAEYIKRCSNERYGG